MVLVYWGISSRWRHDIQNNGIQTNDTERKVIQHNDTQHNNKSMTPSVTTFSITTRNTTLGISDILHNDTHHYGTLSRVLLCWVNRAVFIVRLSVIMPNVVMLEVMAPSMQISSRDLLYYIRLFHPSKNIIIMRYFFSIFCLLQFSLSNSFSLSYFFLFSFISLSIN